MSIINDILRTAVQNKASDVHINVGLPPLFRIHTNVSPADFPIVTAEGAERLLRDILAENRWKAFQELRDADFSYEIPGVGRFRVNAHYQRGSIAMAFRTINDKVRKIEELFPRFNAEEVAVTAHLEPEQQEALASMLRSMLRRVGDGG